PFLYSTSVEGNIVNEVYDKLLAINPDNSAQTIGWMVNFYRLETHATQPAECPASYTNSRGTFNVGECVKVVLRGNISWHDIYNCSPSDSTCLTSHVVTANDVKFSFAAFNSTGGLIRPYTANTIDVVYN